jgi:hypothetical protein
MWVICPKKINLSKEEELLNLIQTGKLKIRAFPTENIIFPQPIVDIFYKIKSG